MKVLTANRLLDGEAVWLSADGRWAETLAEAEAVADKAGEARLEAAGEAGIRDNLVLDVNLIDVELRAGALYPLRLRERIRAKGPTTHPAFNKPAAFTA
jgi:hypothetical protein